jgi:hypothetical protein
VCNISKNNGTFDRFIVKLFSPLIHARSNFF